MKRYEKSKVEQEYLYPRARVTRGLEQILPELKYAGTWRMPGVREPSLPRGRDGERPGGLEKGVKGQGGGRGRGRGGE